MARIHGIDLVGCVKSACIDETNGNRLMGFDYSIDSLPLEAAGVYLPFDDEPCNRPVAYIDGITWVLDDPEEREELVRICTGLLDLLAQLGHLGCLENTEGA